MIRDRDRRIGLAVPILFGVSIIVFLLMNVLPGSPEAAMVPRGLRPGGAAGDPRRARAQRPAAGALSPLARSTRCRAIWATPPSAAARSPTCSCRPGATPRPGVVSAVFGISDRPAGSATSPAPAAGRSDRPAHLGVLSLGGPEHPVVLPGDHPARRLRRRAAAASRRVARPSTRGCRMAIRESGAAGVVRVADHDGDHCPGHPGQHRRYLRRRTSWRPCGRRD